MKILEASEIMAILPHRYPVLMLDRVIDYSPREWLTAIKNVTANEPQFTGHFPDKPTMPGVLIVEAMAQATGVLAHLSNEAMLEGTSIYYLAAVDKCRFRKIVVPGDTLKIHVNLMGEPKRNIWKFEANATVNDEVAASCILMCAAR